MYKINKLKSLAISLLIFIFICSIAIAQEVKPATDSQNKKKSNTKIVYKQREKIDLEDISIQGEFVTPGDFTIESEKNKESNMIYRRKNYKNRLSTSIIYVY